MTETPVHMNNITCQIPCAISDGMFTNECAVEIFLSGGAVASFFMDKSLIRVNGDKHSGYISVHCINSQIQAPDVTVLLPKEAMESGSRWVRVPRDKVVTT